MFPRHLHPICLCFNYVLEYVPKKIYVLELEDCIIQKGPFLYSNNVGTSLCISVLIKTEQTLV